MSFKKIIPMLIVLLFIFPVKVLHSQQGDESTTGEDPVKMYVDQLKALSEKPDEAKFNEIFKASQDFKGIIDKNNSTLEPYWIGGDENILKLDKGFAADLGNYLAKIIKDNLDNPGRIKLVGGYIERLSDTLSENEYKTAAWKVYDNILENLKSATDLTQAMENLNKDLALLGYDKRGEASNKLTELGKRLIEEISIFPLLNDIENLKKLNGTLDKRIKELENGGDGALRRLKKFIKTHVAWFIIGLMVISFIAILIFLFFFAYLRRQLKVEIPSSFKSDEPVENVSHEHNGPPLNSVKGKVGNSTDQLTHKPYTTKTKESKKFWSINDGFSRLSLEIADLKRLNEKYIKSITEKEGIGEEGEEPEVGYERFSKSIEKDIDTKFENLKNNLKLASYERIGDQLSGILEQMRNLMGKSGDPKQVESTILTTERQILLGIWNLESFKAEKAELYRIAKNMEEKQDFFEKCRELANQIGFHKELSSYYDTILRPLRNYQHKLTQFLDVQNVLGKTDYSEPSKNIFEIKQKIYFLVILQHLNQVPELLKFNLEKWFKEEFLDFADQFLRRYQKNEFSGTLSEEMETAKIKIIDILSIFDIEPIPIVLGQTAFNSQVHIAQSNVRDSSMMDGAIAEVIKNGFKEKQGKVWITPEVIVNRV